MLRSSYSAATHNLRRRCSSHPIGAQKQKFCRPQQSLLRFETAAKRHQRSYHQYQRYTTIAAATAAAALALPASYALGRNSEESAEDPRNKASAFSLWPFATALTAPEAHSSDDSKATPNSNNDENNMTAPPTAKIPPGRPETLTKAEEAKLKELWAASMRVFGVVEADSGSALSVTPVAAATTAEEPTHTKKKSLGRLLSRSNSHPPAPATASPATIVTSPVTLDESDDKYGHNKDFKIALASQTSAELREAFWGMVKCDNPDGLLLRFLRARKWDVDRALVMMVATMGWRTKEMNVCLSPFPLSLSARGPDGV